MTNIIDRRLNPRDKSLKNRQRFIDVHKKQIAEGVRNIVDKKDIIDGKGHKNKIRVRPTAEPTFRSDPKTGDKRYVLPGNKSFNVGDRQNKPKSDSGGRGSQGSSDDEGEDDFAFELTEEEFLEFVFEDLELPDFVKKQIKTTTKWETHNAGYKTDGNPSQLDIRKSTTRGLGRRIALKRPKKKDIEELEEKLNQEADAVHASALAAELERLRKRMKKFAWLDPIDLRYRDQVRTPKPQTQGVMFCVMDVSYSMREEEKSISKRFFLLLYLFLKKKYKKLDVVFISHHSEADEVTEHEFFYSTITGGTIVSTATKLTLDIIKKRYNPDDWNIYCAQSSDGDNYFDDEEDLAASMKELVDVCQFFAYIEVYSKELEKYMSTGEPPQTSVWKTYEALENPKLSMRYIIGEEGVWKVFEQLFSKEKK